MCHSGPFFFFFFFFFFFLSFCHQYHNHRVHIYYHANFCSNPTIFQLYHTFYCIFYHKFYHKCYHQPLPILPHTHPPPSQHFLYLRENTGKCFERPAKIFNGLQRFGNNLGGAGGGGGLLSTDDSVNIIHLLQLNLLYYCANSHKLMQLSCFVL